jgi:glycosyltransferase involved in cell wall biosynthesis
MSESILIFNRGYLPGTKFGGPVTSIQNFCDAFFRYYSIKVVACNHDFKSKEAYSNISQGWNSVGNAQVLYLRDEQCVYKNFLTIIEKEKPVLCYLSGTITSYFGFNDGIIKACKEKKVPIIIVPRGDICNNAIKIKQAKKLCAILYCKLMRVFQGIFFQATMDEEAINLKKYFNVNSNHIFEIPNIPTSIEPNLKRVKPQGTIKLVFLSRITAKKNLEDAIKSVNKSKSNLQLDIYGPIEDSTYWQMCQEHIKESPANVVIKYKGALDVNAAKTVFRNYDAFIFETLSENYGHVIVESLMCGCPVILTKNTTPWDDVNNRGGYVADIGEIEEFAQIIDNIANMKQAEYDELRAQTREYAVEKVDMQSLLEKYRKMIVTVQKAVEKE